MMQDVRFCDHFSVMGDTIAHHKRARDDDEKENNPPPNEWIEITSSSAQSTLSYAKAVETAQPKKGRKPSPQKGENKGPRKGGKGKSGKKGPKRANVKVMGKRGKDLTLKSVGVRNLFPKSFL